MVSYGSDCKVYNFIQVKNIHLYGHAARVRHSPEKTSEIFQNIGILRDFLRIFLKSNRIFAKGVRNFYRAMHPSSMICSQECRDVQCREMPQCYYVANAQSHYFYISLMGGHSCLLMGYLDLQKGFVFRIYLICETEEIMISLCEVLQSKPLLSSVCLEHRKESVRLAYERV